MSKEALHEAHKVHQDGDREGFDLADVRWSKLVGSAAPTRNRPTTRGFERSYASQNVSGSFQRLLKLMSISRFTDGLNGAYLPSGLAATHQKLGSSETASAGSTDGPAVTIGFWCWTLANVEEPPKGVPHEIKDQRHFTLRWPTCGPVPTVVPLVG